MIGRESLTFGVKQRGGRRRNCSRRHSKRRRDRPKYIWIQPEKGKQSVGCEKAGRSWLTPKWVKSCGWPPSTAESPGTAQMHSTTERIFKQICINESEFTLYFDCSKNLQYLSILLFHIFASLSSYHETQIFLLHINNCISRRQSEWLFNLNFLS